MEHPQIEHGPVPIIKHHTVLDDRTAVEDKKIPGGTRNRIFWQTALSGQDQSKEHE